MEPIPLLWARRRPKRQRRRRRSRERRFRPTPPGPKSLRLGRETPLRAPASSHRDRSLVAEAASFAVKKSLLRFTVLLLGHSAGSLRRQEVHDGLYPYGHKGDEDQCSGHRLVPCVEVTTDRDEDGAEGEEQHPQHLLPE